MCLFHLGQSLHRQIKKKKMTQLYNDNQQYKTYVRSLAALTFLREEQIQVSFNLLRQKVIELDLQPLANANAAMDIFDYFKRCFVYKFN